MRLLFSHSLGTAICASCLLVWFTEIGLAEPESGRPARVDFENMETGSSPVGFSIALTGKGGPATWVIEEHDVVTGTSKVVVQTSSEHTNYRFPLCVYDDFNATNVELSVRFRPVSGQIDQAAGLVWRYQDPNNYYVVRANALEDNVVLYKMEDGKRSDLKPVGSGVFAYGKKAPVPQNRWSTLRVVVMDDKFAVWLNGEHLFDVRDQTIQGPGQIGLWTKADSVTSFDDLTITSLDTR